MTKYNTCCLDTVQKYTANILAVYHTVTDKTVLKESKSWYLNAHNLARKIAHNTGLPLQVVAGVIAVLSPNQNWIVQEQYTESFINAILAGADYKDVGYGYFTNRAKAVSIIENKRVFPYLSGIKVEAFYHNIMLNTEHVTLDLWAIRIALNKLELPKTKVSFYGKDFSKRDEMIKAYKNAAVLTKLAPSEIQAVTWVAARNIVNV